MYNTTHGYGTNTQKVYFGTCGFLSFLSHCLLPEVPASGLEDELKTLLQEKAMEMGLAIKAVEIMPDHVHVFLTAPPSLEPHYIVNQLKGYTSRILGQEHKWLRSRLPTLWTRSSSIGSAGTVSASIVEKYIENQKGV